MRSDHVTVTVSRESGAKAIGWFGRLAVAYRIGYHKKILFGREQLARVQQFSSKSIAKELSAGACGSVEYQDCIRGSTALVFFLCA